MRHSARIAWTAVALAAGLAPALGQISGTSAGGASGTSSSSGGLGGLSSALGGSSGGLGGGGSSSATQGTALASMPQAPTLTAPSAYASTGSTTNTAINSSNFLGPYYANVYYQGRSGAQLTQAPGGFGVVLYGNNGGGGGGNIGFAGSSNGGAGGGSSSISNFGRSGASGSGSGGAGGINLNNPGGQIVQLPRSIAYPALVKFKVPLPAPAQVNADIRAMLDRSTMLGTPQNVQVLSEGNIIVLRGAVRDEDEAKMVEGMVRLTPGVHAVKNELNFPK